MIHGFWKILLILTIADNFVLNEGRIDGVSHVDNKESSEVHPDVEELNVRSYQKYGKKKHQNELVKRSGFLGEYSEDIDSLRLQTNNEGHDVDRKRKSIVGDGRKGKRVAISTTSNSKYEIHVLDPYEVNEEKIREIIGTKKINEISQCPNVEYDSIKNSNPSPQLKPGENDIKQRAFNADEWYRKRELKTDDTARKIRSKWKLNMRGNDQTYNFKKVLPFEYLGSRKDQDINTNSENRVPLYAVNRAKTYLKGKVESLSEGQVQYLPENGKTKGKENTVLDNFLSDLPVNIIGKKSNKDFEKIVESNPTRTPAFEGNKKSSLDKSNQSQNINKNNEGIKDITVSKEVKNNNESNSSHEIGKSNVITLTSQIIKSKIEGKSLGENRSQTTKDDNVQNERGQQIQNLSQKTLNSEAVQNQKQVNSNEHSGNIIHKTITNSSSEKKSEQEDLGYLHPIPPSSPNIAHKGVEQNELKQMPSDSKQIENKVLHAESEEKKPGDLNFQFALPGNSSEAKENSTGHHGFEKSSAASNDSNRGIKIAQVSNSKQGNSNATKINNTKGVNNVMFSSQEEQHLGNAQINPSAKDFETVKIHSQFRRSIQPRDVKTGNIKITYNEEPASRADDTSNIFISQMKDGFGDSDENINKGPKVIVIQTKQGCPSEVGCAQSTKLVHCADSNCMKTTPCMDNFKELQEGYKEDNLAQFNDLYKVNPKWEKECSVVPDYVPFKCPNYSITPHTVCPNCEKKESKRAIKDKVLNDLSPIIFIQTSNEEKGSEDRKIRGSSIDKDVVNFKDESSLSFEKGNKKIENKILEGFINSIIANYSKDETKASTKEPTENIDKPEDEAVIRLIKDITNKKKFADLENSNFRPIIIPESSLSKYKDLIEYSKLGPYNEAELKSLLPNNPIQLVLKEKVERRRAVK